jgi:hypothetical protein
MNKNCSAIAERFSAVLLQQSGFFLVKKYYLGTGKYSFNTTIKKILYNYLMLN